MLCCEMISVCSENRTEHTETLLAQWSTWPCVKQGQCVMGLIFYFPYFMLVAFVIIPAIYNTHRNSVHLFFVLSLEG